MNGTAETSSCCRAEENGVVAAANAGGGGGGGGGGDDGKGGRGKDSIDAVVCSASDLAAYLLMERFEGDAVAAASFLLECTASLPNAEEISAQLMGGGGECTVEVEEIDEDGSGGDVDEAEAAAALGESVALPGGRDDGDDGAEPASVEVSATVPRSKFDLTLRESGLVLTNKKGERVVISAEDVDHVVVFPKPEDCRAKSGGGRRKSGAVPKRSGSIVLIALREADGEGEAGSGARAKFRGKKLRQVCFQLPQHDAPASPEERRDVDGEWAELLRLSLQPSDGKVVRVFNPAFNNGAWSNGGGSKGGYTFRSDEGDCGTSVTTGGMPFVKCYHGVNDGVLYPLEDGLLFFKPPLFVHRSMLDTISCGRGSSSNGSKYVDLVAALDGDGAGGKTTVEFSNINREELRVLNDYIHKVLVRAMERDAASESDDDESRADAAVVVEENGDSDDESEEEAEENDDRDDRPPARRKRSRRAASRDARAATREQLSAIEARKRARPHQSGEEDDDGEGCDGEGSDEDAEDFDVNELDSDEDDDDDDDDEDEDEFNLDGGIPVVADESGDEGTDSDSEEEEAICASDDDETESETEEEEEEEENNASRPKKKTKTG